MTLPPIALIAPNETLAQQAEKVLRDERYPARIWRSDLENGVQAAQIALEQGARVVISQGDTARLIQSELSSLLKTDVIEIESSWHAVASHLHGTAREGMRIALAGFPSFTKAARIAAESLSLPHRLFEFTCEGDATGIENSITEWKADIVLGDAAVRPLLENLPGIAFRLIEPDIHSVREALDKSMLLVKNLKRMLTDNRRLSTVLECTQAGAIIVDDDGVIEMINQPAMTLLGIAGSRPIGTPITDILRNGDVVYALQTKMESRGILIDNAGEQLHVNVIPLHSTDGASYGTVVSMQRVKNIQAVERQIRNQLHHKGFRARHTLREIVHQSLSMRYAIKLAHAYAKSDANVVITGETGTGKELFAQGIHNASPRAGGMFVAINCATLPATLLESELFGYTSGAFTGATRQGKMGLFELAHNGTIFLDEINEMDLHLQSHLLRAIQEREIMRIGDTKTIPVNVRVIAAANKSLEGEVEKGRLRQDLFFRLNVLNLHLPPLRDRPGDAPLLFRHFLGQHASRSGGLAMDADPEFLRLIEDYPWPGNVRELENAAEKYLVLRDIPESQIIPTARPPRKETASDEESLDDIIRTAIKKTLREEEGNITRASRRLKVNRNTLKRWLRDGERI